MSRLLRVLAINPFHGGSHRQFLDDLADASRHRWDLVTGRSVHWKWRMRVGPLELADAARKAITVHGHPDIVFCTDMLDLPQWRGILRDTRILQTPTVVYFHENQWTYPVAPDAREDFHFAYTNLLSAQAADACWFNSAFHQRDFLRASREFVARMPDCRSLHDFERLEGKSRVLPPGFKAREMPPRSPGEVTRIGWVSRWEADKRADRFCDLLRLLRDRGCAFRLVLLGPRPRQSPESLEFIRQEFADSIDHDGYATSRDQYWSLLSQMDVVVSTADHEYFGIALCEAVWAGAAPIVPNRLSYPELVPQESLYETLGEAATMIEAMGDPTTQLLRSSRARDQIAPLRIERVAERIDDQLALIATVSGR